ncbi:MAG: hypothetical protein G01um101448_755 [Parcubacteria group bacterium Gr01-1014_48]|nr:MAG: hypothetical protein Greene041614_937 [Parcubacteria group bacterium Greene0416_14]TSC73443.1 MAG: hypothetical protein G01um101448_755 [Parcubacteria group bacterium Gr01-1014_48]
MLEKQWASMKCATTIRHPIRTAQEFKVVVDGVLLLRFADGSIGTYAFSGNASTCESSGKSSEHVSVSENSQSTRHLYTAEIQRAEEILTRIDVSTSDLANVFISIWDAVKDDARVGDIVDRLADRIFDEIDEALPAVLYQLGHRGNRYAMRAQTLQGKQRIYFLDGYIGDTSVVALEEEMPTESEKDDAAHELVMLLRAEKGKMSNTYPFDRATRELVKKVDPQLFEN